MIPQYTLALDEFVHITTILISNNNLLYIYNITNRWRINNDSLCISTPNLILLRPIALDASQTWHSDGIALPTCAPMCNDFSRRGNTCYANIHVSEAVDIQAIAENSLCIVVTWSLPMHHMSTPVGLLHLENACVAIPFDSEVNQ